MKPTKTGNTGLPQPHNATGDPADITRLAIETMTSHPSGAIKLLELTLDEARKKRADKVLIDTYIFAFGQALESLRYGIEAGYRTSLDSVEDIRKRLVSAIQSGRFDPAVIWGLVQGFGSAKLELGDELGRAFELFFGKAGEAAIPSDLRSFVARMVKEAKGDPFRLFSHIQENSTGVPDDHRAAMCMAFLFSGEAAAAEASIGWLLDAAAPVRRAAADALADAGRRGIMTPTMLRRMITMRNWLPADDRAPLDAAIATTRRRGVPPAQWDDVEVRAIETRGVDGSGAIGFLAHARHRRKNRFSSLVLKLGSGVRDAWVEHGLKDREVRETLAQSCSVRRFEIVPDCIRDAVGHFLAVGHQTALMPPFGLVGFLETVGVAAVQPEPIGTAALLDRIEEGRAIDQDTFDRLLAQGPYLADAYPVVESWFEPGDDVDAVLRASRRWRKNREGLIMEKMLDPRRQAWAEKVAWMTYILHQAQDEERWQQFYVAARALLQGRPLKEIPLMVAVAEQTVRAWEYSRGGSLKERLFGFLG